MTKTKSRYLDFFDRHVSKMICDKYGLSEMESIRLFITSETYKLLTTEETEIYTMSPFAVFDMWECEKIQGDPRSSVYIREE